MTGELRILESVFETVFDNLDNAESDEPLVSPQDATEAYEVRKKIEFDETSLSVNPDAYTNAVALVTTVISRLSSTTAKDISENQKPILKDIYRFTSGPLRECQHQLDSRTDANQEQILLDRIQKEVNVLEQRLTDAELLAETEFDPQKSLSPDTE